MSLLALFLQGSSVGHMWLVEHTKCPEHGELVHAEKAHSLSASSVGDVGSAIRGSTNTERSPGHDHCLEAVERRSAKASPAAPVADGPVGDSVSTPVMATDIHDTSPRFRVAPKTSPPA